MGFIRGGLFVVLSVLFFISLLTMGIFFTLDLSLKYDNLKPGLISVVKDIAENEMDLTKAVNENFEIMELYCLNNSEFVFNEEGYTFVIPCEVVAEGSDAVIEKGLSDIIDNIYYKDYNCDFWKCFGESGIPFFLVSQKAKDYWNSKFYFSLVISIILIIIMFFLIEQKTNLAFVAGFLLLISSLLFMKLSWVFSFVSDKSFWKFFEILFLKSYTVFLIFMIIGIVVLTAGIILKFFKIGFKISNIFNKKDESVSKEEVKSIVKKEMSVSEPKNKEQKKTLQKEQNSQNKNK